MNLSPTQQRTLDDMTNAPIYNGSHQWCDTFKLPYDNSHINGNWNSNTLKAMERKGIISIIKIGDWWNDVVKIL